MPYICFDALNFLLFMQCASAIDNFATFYFNHVTVGEPVASSVALSTVGLIAEFPELFSRVSLWLACCLDSSLFSYNLQFVNSQLQDCQQCIIWEVQSFWWLLFCNHSVQINDEAVAAAFAAKFCHLYRVWDVLDSITQN